MTETAKRPVPSRPVARAARGLWRARWPLAFVGPWAIIFAVFHLWPYIYAVWLSLVDWQGAKPAVFVGLDNFRRVMTDDRFWASIGNVLVLFLLYVPAMVLLSLVFAAVLNARFVRLKGVWLALLVLPHVTSMVAAAYTFKLIFDTHSGIANTMLGAIGLGPVPWFDDIWWARIALSILVIWGSLGFNTIIALAGMQSIPAEIMEAAKVDGASSIGAWFRITIPLLRPVIVFLSTISIIGMIELFTEPYVLTRGGPIAATETPAMRIFTTMFQQVRFGYAASMGIVALVLVVIVTLVQFWLANRGEAMR